MKGYQFCCGMFMLSLLAGASANHRHARAVDPAPCPQFKCRTVHAGWPGGAEGIMAYFLPGGDDTANSSTALWNIYTGASNEMTPIVPVQNEKVDFWVYDACVPMCGKDKDGKWQVQQEVGRAGKRVGIKPAEPDVLRFVCSAKKAGDDPMVANPKNLNTDNNSPPGYKAEMGGDD